MEEIRKHHLAPSEKYPTLFSLYFEPSHHHVMLFIYGENIIFCLIICLILVILGDRETERDHTHNHNVRTTTTIGLSRNDIPIHILWSRSQAPWRKRLPLRLVCLNSFSLTPRFNYYTLPLFLFPLIIMFNFCQKIWIRWLWNCVILFLTILMLKLFNYFCFFIYFQ